MDIYITVVGLRFYHGKEFAEKNMEFTLEKEPDNKYDKEAIKVLLPGLGQIGYVANSPRTVVGDCFSAGRLYDKMGKKCFAKLKYCLDNAILCKVKKKSLLPAEDRAAVPEQADIKMQE